MGSDTKKSGILGQIISTVVIALLVGGTSPWWWDKLFSGEGGSDTSNTGTSSSGTTSKPKAGQAPVPSDKTLNGQSTLAKGPLPDFEGGSRRIYSAPLGEWPVNHTEHGLTKIEYGTYVLEPNANTWVGPGRWLDIAPLQSDFVLQFRFRILKRNPSAALSFGISGSDKDADYVKVYLDVWSDQNVTYSAESGRIKDSFYVVRERAISERETVRDEISRNDWSKGGTLNIMRDGGVMRLFVNEIFLKEFPVSRFPVAKISVGAAFASTIQITSIEARVP